MTEKAVGAAKGSPLRQRMIDQMRIANLAAITQTPYLFEVERMAKPYDASPADLDAEQVRDFVLTLIDRGLSPASINSTLSALRFLYVETQGCLERVAGARNRKLSAQLPRSMTEQEVERLILATPDLQHRAAFVSAYGAGLRVRRDPPAEAVGACCMTAGTRCGAAVGRSAPRPARLPVRRSAPLRHDRLPRSMRTN